ncbi:hypothetical protein ACFLX2_00460 [Candidatus Dependentiae bacterium]
MNHKKTIISLACASIVLVGTQQLRASALRRALQAAVENGSTLVGATSSRLYSSSSRDEFGEKIPNTPNPREENIEMTPAPTNPEQMWFEGTLPMDVGGSLGSGDSNGGGAGGDGC